MGGREGGSAVALFVLDGSTLRAAGAVNGLATLDASATVPLSQIPAALRNGSAPQGGWNAATNTPTLPPGTEMAGDFWIVTTAGATALPGAAGPWTVGQVAFYNGVTWEAMTYYSLALGLPVAGASPGWVLYVNGSGNLATAAPGATSGIQAYSANLAAVAAGDAPGVFGLDLLATADATGARNLLVLVPGTDVQAQSAILQALADLGTTGLLARTGAGTLSPRTITGTADLVTVSNGDGVGGNPTITVGSNVYRVGGIDVAVADGGTGAGTVAGAQANLAVQGVAWRSTSSGTDTLTIADETVEYGASCTVTLPSGALGIAGKSIRLIASAAGVTLTIQRAGSDTIDGGTSISVALGTSRAACAVVRQSTSTAWGSVQPGALADANLRLRMYVSSSVVYVALDAYLGGSWATVKGPAVVTKTAGTAGLGTTASGTGFNFPAGYAVVAATMTASDRWVEPCDGTGALAVTWTPGSYTGARCTLAVDAALASGANYVAQMAFIGDADFTPGIRLGLGRASGGSGTLFSQGNDAAFAAAGVACAWSGPALGYLGWQAAGAFCEQASVRGPTTGGMSTGSLSTLPSGTLGAPTIGLVCGRSTLGGGAQTSSNVELCVYVPAGELTW